MLKYTYNTATARFCFNINVSLSQYANGTLDSLPRPNATKVPEPCLEAFSAVGWYPVSTSASPKALGISARLYDPTLGTLAYHLLHSGYEHFALL